MSKSFSEFAALVLSAGLASGCISSKAKGGLEDPDLVTAPEPDASVTMSEPVDPQDPSETLDSGTPAATDDPNTVLSCVFHVDAPPVTDVDAGMMDAGTLLNTSVTVASNAFLGEYLADDAGRSLYIYGADFPGDCNTPPVSNCSNDCLLAWPVFDAGERSLPEGLSDDGFGYIDRADGARQTTYQGWPLYYFTDDLAPMEVDGHGRGEIWFAAELQMPNLVVMRSPLASGGVKYLGTGEGRTLYSFGADLLGNASTSPISTCTGSCFENYQPFMPRSLRAVSTLESANFEVFARVDGLGTQLAYKGSPLYTATADINSGDWNGIETGTWEIVLP